MSIMYRDLKLGEFFLLLSQFFERIAHYSITASIVPVLLSRPLNWRSKNAVAAPFLLNGFCFISSMAGGILSDTYIRKTTTVVIGYAFYITYIGFPYVFWINDKIPWLCQKHNISNINNSEINIIYENCSEIIMPSIIFSSIGSGLIRSVAASIGADMVNKKWENPSTFFNLYYWCLNCGSLMAFLVFSLIQQNFSRKWGYGTPTVILALSFITFLLGGPYYVHTKRPSRSSVALILKVYCQAIKKKIAVIKRKFQNTENTAESQENIFARMHTESLFNEDSEAENDFPDSFSSVPRDNSLGKKSEFDSYTYPKLNSINRPSGQEISSSNFVETETYSKADHVAFLDRCQIRFGGSFTEEDVQDVRRFTFIFNILLFMIPYYLIYFQMESTYMFQGMRMLVDLGSFNKHEHFNIPTSWLIVIDIMLLMVLLPFLAKIVYPWLRAKKMYFRHTTKIVTGFVFVFLSVVCAGIVEVHRLNVRWLDHAFTPQNISNTVYDAANVTIFLQVPQFVAMGLSEAFAVVAGLELACTQVSGPMQGLANSLFWFASGLGSFCGTGTLELFSKLPLEHTRNCTPDNMHCHLNIYFFSLSVFLAVITGILTLFLWKYRDLEKMEQNQLLMRRVSA